ncbi:MAG: glycosyl hydrolase [Bacteroidota bacterium]
MRVKHKQIKSQLLNYLLIFSLLLALPAFAAKKEKEDEKVKSAVEKTSFSGLKWRNIGPAFTSGRISDFAVNPNNFSEYYVAVSSGHIWKTVNNGTTWSPVFDKYGVYSIGALAMDPKNPNVVWAGTGENNHQRALGYGNGIYKTEDGGKSWKNMGLKESRQIGMIAIDPRNSDVVYIAAEGSAWGPGGERGLYKTTDGGKNWKKILEISENTGVNNVVIDPCDPDVIYATSEQRRRHVYTKIGGGPESAFYKSTDSGATWNKVTSGLPKGHVGGMGIAISPVDHNVIYLIIEAQDEQGGFFRSTDRGASFSKMSSYHSSGQYYNEIVADPKNVDVVYSLETRTMITTDGGKNWSVLGNNARHVDDHAMWIDPKDTSHIMIGGDGGVYESFDGGKNYIFKSNLPVTQFYRVFADNSFPFYWVYGGTQDNNSFGGPNQNTSNAGVTMGEWVVTLGGDGFWQAVDADDPNIVYSEYQYGNVSRYDKKSGESTDIKPAPVKGEDTYRWNWDAPMILSTHQNQTLYMAANKVFKSTDRGNSWVKISEDITRNEDRNKFPVMGKYWPSNAVVKDVSTSQWGTIVSLAESPLKADLIYAGTDDGLIQVTDNGGKTWTKTSVFPGVPEYTYVSDILPSRFNENVVYASFNNLQSDDFKPYLLKSADKGKTWTSISNNLPENGSIHTIEQDFVNENLLFVGTEFSFFVSVDGGKFWKKLDSGLPDIAVRDITIQKRENDLVIATFGRGFFILDDYSALREVNEDFLKTEGHLFPIQDALMYVQTGSRYGQGSTVYFGENPDFGAAFTYYLNEVPKTLKDKRLKKEEELFKNSQPIPQPTKEELKAEQNQSTPYLVFSITDSNGDVVRNIYKKPSGGINRVNWNLRYQGVIPGRRPSTSFDITNNGPDRMFAMPGTYKVSMSLVFDEKSKLLAGPVDFNAKVLENTTLGASDRAALVAFQKQITELGKTMDGAERYLNEMKSKMAQIRQAIHNTPACSFEMGQKAKLLSESLDELTYAFEGTPARASYEEVPPEQVALNERLSIVSQNMWRSTSAPTQTAISNYEILVEEFPRVLTKIKSAKAELETIENKLNEIGAIWTPGRLPEFLK